MTTTRLANYRLPAPSPQGVADCERLGILAAEKELHAIELIARNTAMSPVALERIVDGLKEIRIALNLRRLEVGLAVRHG